MSALAKPKETPEQIAARYGAIVNKQVTVQKIERGVSGDFVYPVWTGLHLIYPDGEQRFQSRQNVIKRNNTILQPELVEKIKEALYSDKTWKQIEKELHISNYIMKKAAALIGPIPKKKSGQTEQVRKNEKKIRAIYSPDKTAMQMAEETGMNIKLLRSYLTRMGLKAKRYADQDAIDARKARIKELHEQGVKSGAIANEVGLTRSVVIGHLERMEVAK